MIYVKRLHKGADLLLSINQIARENHIAAGVILSGVGCLSTCVMRCADGKTVHELNQRFEIVSLTGTVSENRTHLHISVADTSLSVLGGHLCPGCIVNTTVELAVQTIDHVGFEKEYDPQTGYNELSIINEQETKHE